jgi:hypothetical protein
MPKKTATKKRTKSARRKAGLKAKFKKARRRVTKDKKRKFG